MDGVRLLNILMLSWRGPHHPRRGGAEVYTTEILAGLARKGHHVSWYSANPGRDIVQEPWRGIELLYGRQAHLGIYWEGFLWLKRHVQSYDVIIDQINTFGFLAPRVVSESHSKVVALIHQLAKNVWDYEVIRPFNLAGRMLERRVLATYNATPYITVSSSTLIDLKRAGWKGRHTVVPNGVEVGSRSRPPKSSVPTIAFLGRVNAKSKRLDHAIRIHRLVRRALPQTQFWIIGRGELPRSIKRSMNSTITHYANITDDKRDELLAQAWICLAPSVREGWGRMVSEAAAVGTPSVVYNVHGLRDAVVNNVTGLIVPPTPKQAATWLINLIENSTDLDMLSNNAYQHAMNFSWSRSVNLFESAITQYCQDSPFYANF